MHSKHFISLVVVNFNGLELLPEFFSAVFNLDYPKELMEIIFVDDKSSNSPLDFIRKNYPQIKIVRNTYNLGPAASRNKGILRAKGDLIATLDNDVLVSPRWLKELAEVIDSDPQIGVCASKLLFYGRGNENIINSAGGIMNLYGDGYDRGVFEIDRGQYGGAKQVLFGCSAAMLIRKSVIDAVGFFDRDFFYLYDDLDFCWRVNLAGYKVMYIPEAVARHKLSHTMERDTLRSKYLIEKNRILTLLKNYSSATIFDNWKGFVKQRGDKIRANAGARHPLFLLLCAGLAAWFWNIFHIRGTLKKRKEIQKRIRRVSDAHIFRLIEGNI